MNIQNIIAGSHRAASKYLFFLLAFVGVISMTSCSEDDGVENEFENWETPNQTYFNNIYDKADAAIKAGDNSWKLIRTFTKNDVTATAKNDFIVVHVENEGTGTESPIYSDSVRVHYRGNLIPSKNYANGYQFCSSWSGEYNIKTMIPKDMNANGVLTDISSYSVIGLSTALMNMRQGDRWIVYIPYTLGYGIGDVSSIPGYSTLKFDITLVNFVHKGEKFPAFQ